MPTHEDDDPIIAKPPLPDARPWPTLNELALARGLLEQIRDLTSELAVRLGRLERAARGWPIEDRFASDPYERSKDRGGVAGGAANRPRAR